MKVDKDKFDTLLGKLMQTPPQPAKSIEIEGKAGKIIPPIQQSDPHKATARPRASAAKSD